MRIDECMLRIWHCHVKVIYNLYALPPSVWLYARLYSMCHCLPPSKSDVLLNKPETLIVVLVPVPF